ncbi:MAG: ABC transporter ATP-binding protein, partial [Actinomycetota bacterium]
MSEAPLLAAVGVTYTYPAGPIALDHVDVEIARGERLALLGGNGSGKSTLLLLLNASLKPATGAVRLNGRNVGWSRRDRNQHRRRVGLVLQDPDDQLFSASVFEDVSFGPLNLGLDEVAARQRVEEMLDRLGLIELAERPAHLLSFGQRKRVAIAGVAAMRPEVVLLDEHFAGLDPTARHEVMATLDQLEADGATVALATHNVDLAYGWADRVVVLADGTVAAAGPPATVLHDAERCAAARLRRPGLVDLLDAAVDAGWLEQPEA